MAQTFLYKYEYPALVHNSSFFYCAVDRVAKNVFAQIIKSATMFIALDFRTTTERWFFFICTPYSVFVFALDFSVTSKVTKLG